MRFLHVLSAAVLIGGILARQIVRSLAKKTDDVQRFAIMSQAAGRIESTMVIPGNMAVVVLGVILALILGAPMLGFLQGADRNWLLVSNILLVIGLLNVPLVFIPRGRKFEPILKDAVARGEMTAELRAALSDPVVRLAHVYEMAMIVVVVYLMVFKPF